VDGGFLVYASQGVLRAVAFDPETLTVHGDSTVLVDHLLSKAASGAVDFSAARNGNLAYVRGSVFPNVQRTLTWVDRNGQETPISAKPLPYAYARLSPDGTRIALDVRDETSDIWMWNFSNESLMPLTRTPGLETSPIWTNDG